MEFEAKRAVYILLYIANIDEFKFKIDSLASLCLTTACYVTPIKIVILAVSKFIL